MLTRNGATTYLSEVAHVRDGFSPQTNIVRQNGERGVLVSIIKNGGSSTLDIVSTLLAQLPVVAQILPKDLKITPLFDQSGFVRAAISGVVREARDRRLPDRRADPAVSRQLAQHLHHRRVDSAVDPVLDHRAVSSWARRSTS